MMMGNHVTNGTFMMPWPCKSGCDKTHRWVEYNALASADISLKITSVKRSCKGDNLVARLETTKLCICWCCYVVVLYQNGGWALLWYGLRLSDLTNR